MITVLTGDNSYEIDQYVKKIIAGFSGDVEKIDGEQLEIKNLPDLFMGATLFANERLVVVKNIASNKVVWEELSQWLEKISDDIHLVLVDPQLDKRTRTYKELKKKATVHELKMWTERDTNMAAEWLEIEAKKRDVTLRAGVSAELVARVGLDQWELSNALDKVAVLETVDVDTIKEVIEGNPSENVFDILSLAVSGDRTVLREKLDIIAMTEDPYKFFGLVSSQAFQLVAIKLSGKSSKEVAADIAAHPFVLAKLSSVARQLTEQGAKTIIDVLADADARMKTSGGDPWVVIDHALLAIHHNTAHK